MGTKVNLRQLLPREEPFIKSFFDKRLPVREGLFRGEGQRGVLPPCLEKARVMQDFRAPFGLETRGGKTGIYRVDSQQSLSRSKMKESSRALFSERVSSSRGTPLLKQAFKTDAVGQEAIARAPKKPSAVWKTPEYMYLAGDIASLPRLSASLVNTIHGRPDPAGLQGLGLTSSLSVLTGYIAGRRGYDEYERSGEIGDTTGQVSGIINMARAPMEIMTGLTFVPFRSLSIAATYTSAKSVTVAAGVFFKLGSAFGALGYLLLMIPSFIFLTQNISFHRKLSTVMNAPENKTEAQKYAAGLKFMIDALKGTPDDWEQAVVETVNNPLIREGEHVKDVIVDPEELELLSKEELDFIEDRIDREGYDMHDHPKMIEHTKQAFINMKKRKEVEFSRKTGFEATALVKKAGPLLELLKVGKGVADAKMLFGKIDVEKWKNRILHGAIIFFCAVGVFALVAGMFVSGGGIGIAIAAAWVVTMIGMLAIDGYFFYKACQSGSLETSDKLIFFIANALLLMTVGAGIVFSGGLVPLIISGVVGGLWMLLAGYSYKKWTPQPKTKVIEDPVERHEAPYRGHGYAIRKEKLA